MLTGKLALVAAVTSAGCYAEVFAGAGSVEHDGKRDGGYTFGLAVGSVLPGPAIIAGGLGEVVHRGDGLDAAGEAIQARVDVDVGRARLVGTGHYGFWRHASAGEMSTRQEGRVRGAGAGLGLDLPWAPLQRMTLSVGPAFSQWDHPGGGFGSSLGAEVRLRWLLATTDAFTPSVSYGGFGRLITLDAIDMDAEAPRQGPERPSGCKTVTTHTPTDKGMRTNTKTVCE